MATQSNLSEAQALSNQVDTLLRAYEQFFLQQDVSGVSGYAMQLRTNTYIHLKHTNKTLFRRHSVYMASSLTALPNIAFIKEWLKNGREASDKLLRKGEYQEYLDDGGYRLRKFNQWFYYDGVNRKLVGEVQVNDLVAPKPLTNTDTANPPSPPKRGNK